MQECIAEGASYSEITVLLDSTNDSDYVCDASHVVVYPLP